MNTEEKLAYWAGVMKRYEASSLKQGVFCQKEGLSLSSFHKWRSRVFANHRNQEPSDTGMSFASVCRAAAPMELISAELVTLELPNKIKLTIRAGAVSKESMALIRCLMKEI